MAASTKKTTAKLKDYIPVLLFGGFFLALIAFPKIRDNYFPAVTTKVVEWKEKVVQVEKEKIVHDAPTVSINTLKAKLIRVIDADTAVFDIELPLHLKIVDQHVRCTGYDGFELTEINGLQAKQALEDLLKDSSIYIIVDKKERDSFGRILAEVFCRKNDKVISIAEYMISNKFSKPEK